MDDRRYEVRAYCEWWDCFIEDVQEWQQKQEVCQGKRCNECEFFKMKEENKLNIKNLDVVERDNKGNVIGWGSHADYSIYDVDVMNGKGYYDNNGHYHRYRYNDEG